MLSGLASNLLGLAFGLVAGACWAAYIVLNRVVGARLPGLQVSAVASALYALGDLPVLVKVGVHGGWDVSIAWQVLAAGLLCSVVPFAADVTA
ncbi:hypothetical protein [Isoptericola croceus]|uniref:hypothetical protein n=1 Tax=Isoptericola croceus TaxID=3031406 RepID=UPI0023F7CDA6|nr:hypothetical protein [Isoptericola croceus]